MATRFRKVVIAGGGTAGWMTAAMLSRLLGTQLDITLVESDAIGTIGVGEATIPPIRLFNNVVGINEDEFLRHCQGTLKLGIEFSNWGAIGDRYMHAFGSIGRNVGLTPFHHLWLREKKQGGEFSLWDYSLTSRAAYAGRFDRMEKIPNTPVDGLNWAFHFDAGLYAHYLRKGSEQSGVKRIEGKIESVIRNPESGDIESLLLESQQMIEGDLFIDCTGFRGLLISETMEVGWEDWSSWLPCNKAVAVQSANTGPGRAYTQSIAHSAGWQWRIPLQHRTGNGHVFCDEFISEDEATATLIDNLEGEIIGAPRTIPFHTGMRANSWRKNCVAIGLSNGFLEPLESTAIHMIQSAIIRLVKMFPSDTISSADVEEYNRQTRVEIESIRDFIITHYHLTQRDDSGLWRYTREMEVPESVTRKIDQFRHSGLVFREETDLFSELAWLQVLHGQGIDPDTYSPLADTLTDQELKGYMSDMRTILDRTMSRLPVQAEFIARNCAAPAP